MKLLITTVAAVAAVCVTASAEQKPESHGRLVPIEIRAPDGKVPFPRELVTCGGSSFVHVQLSSHVYDNAVYRIEGDVSEAVTLEDGAAFKANVMVPQPGTPFVFVRTESERAYFRIENNIAKPVSFDPPVELGKFYQFFHGRSGDFFWDGNTASLYRITGTSAKRLETKLFHGARYIAVAKARDGWIVSCDPAENSPQFRLLYIGADLEVQQLELPEVLDGDQKRVEADSLQVASTRRDAFVCATFNLEGHVYIVREGKLKPVTHANGRAIIDADFGSFEAAGESLYFASANEAGEHVLWRRADDGSMTELDLEGMFLVIARGDHDSIAVRSSDFDDRRVYLIRDDLVVKVEHQSDEPEAGFDDFRLGENSAWGISNDLQEHRAVLYHVDAVGNVEPAKLSDGTAITSDTSVKRSPTGAGIFEGMELLGDGNQLYLRWWNREGCRLFRLAD
ncbi:MAG: hypothetical protein KDB68_10170 [Planctomycetes bacterium]|nr:hypothetical protein [Planctomycetota bacterium]